MPEVTVPKGRVAVTTYGSIMVETCQSLVGMVKLIHELGLGKLVDFDFLIGNLVDKVRNEAAAQLLRSDGQWIWFLDADMAFDPKLAEVMLATAFGECDETDIIGGWCALRSPPHLPTIDTGTGTWESHGANKGPIKVMRTGAACLLVKRHVFEKMKYPWFGVRPAPRPLDMIYEVDNYFRIKFDGENPVADTPQWQQLLKCATEDAQAGYNKPQGPDQGMGAVGEDSAFCDRAKALGFRIVVQTNAICGHVDRKLLLPKDHAEVLNRESKLERAAMGILE